MKYKIKAQNIKCDGCASKIKESLNQIKNVHQVVVNIEEGTVTVETDGNISQKLITDRLREIGYPGQESFLTGLKKIFLK